MQFVLHICAVAARLRSSELGFSHPSTATSPKFFDIHVITRFVSLMGERR